MNNNLYSNVTQEAILLPAWKNYFYTENNSQKATNQPLQPIITNKMYYHIYKIQIKMHFKDTKYN